MYNFRRCTQEYKDELSKIKVAREFYEPKERDPNQPSDMEKRFVVLRQHMLENPNHGLEENDIKDFVVNGKVPKSMLDYRANQMEAKLQVLLAGDNPYIKEEVIKAFMDKKPLKVGAHESTGDKYFLYGHHIATHTDKGIKVNNAGYPTPTTHGVFKRMGVDAKVVKGNTIIHGKPYKNGTNITVPYNELKNPSDLIKKSDPSNMVKREGVHSSEYAGPLRNIQKRVKEIHGNRSPTATQPEDYKTIEKITGIKTKNPKEVRGEVGHHILYKNSFPELAHNPRNIIPQSREEHNVLHKLNPEMEIKKFRNIPKGYTPKPASGDKYKHVLNQLNKIKKEGGGTKALNVVQAKVIKGEEQIKSMVTLEEVQVKYQKLATMLKTEGGVTTTIPVKKRPNADEFESDPNHKVIRVTSPKSNLQPGDNSVPSDENHIKNILDSLVKKKQAKYTDLTPSLNHPDNPDLPTFSEAQRVFNGAKHENKVDYKKGFSYTPHDGKSYDANNKEDALEMQKKFGNKKDPLHIIARTDNQSEYLDENHKHAGKTLKEHYNDIVKEDKTPIIGGYDEGKFKTTDIATAEPLSDEKARENLKKFSQRSSGRIDLNGKFSIFS